jgi:hypothetical protein
MSSRDLFLDEPAIANVPSSSLRERSSCEGKASRPGWLTVHRRSVFHVKQLTPCQFDPTYPCWSGGFAAIDAQWIKEDRDEKA